MWTAKPRSMSWGMSSLSGLSETWLLELHDSFGSLEDLDKAISGFSLANAPQPKALIGIYLAGLSCGAEQAAQNLPKTRYFDIVTYRIRPDTQADFAKLLKARRSKLDSINLDRPDIVYQIVYGALLTTTFGDPEARALPGSYFCPRWARSFSFSQ